jgi:deazaflavin-dependent oxidoreductase (nitroreductase family)
MGLGGLMGSRFLLLKHHGRRTGLIREAVIEIIQRDEKRDQTYVAAAWGERSDWYRNLQEDPQVEICIGTTWKQVEARTVPVVEAHTILGQYAQRHPTAARSLARLMGFRVERVEGFAELATHLSLVVFEPLRTADPIPPSS